MPALLIFSTIFLVAGLFFAWFVHGRSRMDIVVEPNAPCPGDLPLISVIVPARDEERNIHRCIQALRHQTYPQFELIVVDDRSTDHTPAILAELAGLDPRLHIIRGAELPPGWAGKPHAMVQGAEAARGEWLCFMDADTFAEPLLLASAYCVALEHAADMFSILTRQELDSFWERTVLPLVFLGLAFGFPAQRVNDPTKPDAIANGQFILIKRAVYEKTGGHAAVRAEVAEDKAIAVLVKRSGYRLLLADGRKVASTRMYTSLPEMWEGWTKNIYLGMRDRLWLLIFAILLGVVVSVALPLWFFGGIAGLASGGGLPAAIFSLQAFVLMAYLVWKRWQACQAFGIPAGYAFTFPLGSLIFTGLMLNSALSILSGKGVLWKGRRYH